MSWAQRYTDIAAREGKGRGGGYSTNFYTAEAHPLTFYIPFFTISYTFHWHQDFVSVLTAGNPHCHKIRISHKYRTLSRRVRGWTSGRSLPIQIFVEYLSGISGGAFPYRPWHTGSTLPTGITGNNHIPGQIKLRYMHEVIPHIQDLRSLCTDVPPTSEKIGRRDVCESPTIIVFPFPRFFLREGGRLYTG